MPGDGWGIGEAGAVAERRIGRPGWALIAAVALSAAGYAGLRLWDRWRDRTIDARMNDYQAIIQRHAEANDLPPDLVRAVVRVESGGDPRAVSRTNARGLMQIMPSAEQDVLNRRRIERGDLFDPDYNVRIGACYLRQLIDRFDGDLYLALAAYNWGPTNVATARSANPELSGRPLVERFAPDETVEYCRRVLAGRPDRLPPRAR